ncbi:GNAT family N-acetyltransferase [Hydrogenophaga sp.]|uniref:GNAT family N-acetyltransferase n=1 Tax=Hydrogenophaga sp. TaxID=1904254 RepID=UPI0035B2BD18
MSSTPFTIAPMHDGDRQAFVHFELRNRPAFERYNRARSPHHYTPAGLDEAFGRLLSRQSVGQLHIWVARHQFGHWLGRVALFAHQQRGQAWGLVAYQTDLDHCRLGVATQLVRQCVIEAVALGYSWLDAQVTHDNEASMAVLTRCGFQHDGPDEPAELTRGIVQTLRLRRVVQVPGPLVLHHTDVRLTS